MNNYLNIRITLFSIILYPIILAFTSCTLKRDNPFDINNPNNINQLADSNIITITPNNIKVSEATCGGIIKTPLQKENVTSFGICFDKNSNPDISKSIVTGNGKSDTFLCTMSGLNPNTIYHCRAFIIVGSSITKYGNDVEFRTLDLPKQDLPQVSTVNPDLITTNSARSGGNILSMGKSPISSRGVCWDTKSGATITLTTKTNDGSGIGVFSSSAISLTKNTKYFLRAYATNSSGTSYGNEITFTTTNSTGTTVPVLSTSAINSISSSSAMSGGTIINDGGSVITAKGICWSTTSGAANISLPTKTNDGTGTGVYTSTISGLSPSTTYYVRAYATNSNGTDYGNQVMFTTSSLPCFITSSTTGTTYAMSTTGGSIFNQGDSYTITMSSSTFSFGQANEIALYNNESKVHSFGTFLNFASNRRTITLPSGIPNSDCYIFLGDFKF